MAVAIVALIALVIGLVQYSTSVPDQESSSSLSVPPFSRPPALDLRVLDSGEHVDSRLARAAADGRIGLRELRGSAVVVNFWASWCRPCQQEAGLLARTAHRWARRGVVILGVNQNDELADALGFVDRFRADYPTLRQPGDAAARRWKVPGFPVTYFVDRTGRAVAASIGLLSAASLEAGIARAVGGPA